MPAASPRAFLDLQVNGAAGHDLSSEPGAVWAVGDALAAFGVGAFLPTLVSPSFEAVDRAREVLAGGPPAGYRGATPLGWHVEGPFISPARAGAHDPVALRAIDRGAARDWSPATGIRMVTLAPELPGALGLVADLVGRGVVVSAGHSAASLVEARAGFDAGIRAVTHLFNAMSPLDHRDPGLPGAALLDERVTLGLIPDGRHVHPAMVKLAWRLAGPDRLAIVTDAMAGLGMAPGRYRLAHRDVDVVEDGDGLTARRLDDRGLAGSVLAMDQAVRNLAAFTGCSPAEATAAATTVPERLLGA